MSNYMKNTLILILFVSSFVCTAQNARHLKVFFKNINIHLRNNFVYLLIEFLNSQNLEKIVKNKIK